MKRVPSLHSNSAVSSTRIKATSDSAFRSLKSVMEQTGVQQVTSDRGVRVQVDRHVHFERVVETLTIK
jgi:hypothetical protein